MHCTYKPLKLNNVKIEIQYNIFYSRLFSFKALEGQ